jgi:hypothetical protein
MGCRPVSAAGCRRCRQSGGPLLGRQPGRASHGPGNGSAPSGRDQDRCVRSAPSDGIRTGACDLCVRTGSPSGREQGPWEGTKSCGGPGPLGGLRSSRGRLPRGRRPVGPPAGPLRRAPSRGATRCLDRIPPRRWDRIPQRGPTRVVVRTCSRRARCAALDVLVGVGPSLSAASIARRGSRSRRSRTAWESSSSCSIPAASTRSLRAEAAICRTWRRVRAASAATLGSRSGPNTSRATTTIMMISPKPMSGTDPDYAAISRRRNPSRG